MSKYEGIVEIINKVLERNRNDRYKEIKKMDRSISLTEDLGFDSIELADMTVLIEDKYGVDVFEERIINTLGEVVDEIEKNS